MLTSPIDWNPASDQQALARVWRDGQKKNCTWPLSDAFSALTLLSRLRVSLPVAYIYYLLEAMLTMDSVRRALLKRRSFNGKLTSKLCLLQWSTRRKASSVTSVLAISRSYSSVRGLQD